MRKKVIFEEKPNPNEPEITDSMGNNQQVLRAAYKQGVKDGLKQAIPDIPQSSVDKSTQRGTEEHFKEIVKDTFKVNEKLKNTLERDNYILFQAKTVFPLDLFPDTLIIDPLKITIVTKRFFATEQITTISLKDLVDVKIETALFFSNLTINYLPKSEMPMGMIEPISNKICLLKKNDAHKAKNLLKGTQVAQREGIDISKIKPDELKSFIEDFGAVKVSY